ncbi:hypothetical protein [Isoptericola sp. QY 916]|uniref:hypothetical protein n=1 Tax=Isoptericola sp. QY 916 TaxID=2782570 RepID=UPI003D300047|nr:hypothetical protein [Isoptericola sp. QY 916]
MPEPTRAGATVRRVAVLVVAAMVCVLAGGGIAWAWWRGSGTAAAPTTQISAGTVDVQVANLGNGLVGRGGTVSLPALTLPGAVPGSGASEIVTVRNGGSRPTTVTATPTRTGTLGTSFTTSASFGAADTETGCGAGNGTSATIPAGGTAALCVAVTLSASAPSTVQGQAGGVSVALAASLGGTAWTDTGTVVSGAVSAATVPAPTLSCGALGLVSVTFNWTAVANATRYQFTFGPAATPTTVQVPAGTTNYQVTGVATNASARVRAERVFTGNVVWTSVPSNTRTYNIALGLIGTCT